MEQRELGRFAGAAVMITGGGHGIGRACASRMADEGARIAVADIDQTAARQVASSLSHEEQRQVAAWLDVTDGSSVERAVADAASELGGLDVLISVGEPEDVAAAVAFLASSDAAWITGHTLPVDGGLMTGARRI
jgi:NAD(P)-dependent dehydrogenase (short-subunit alcohol dehydrogenase family)